MSGASFDEILRVLLEEQVEFIVVGMAAAVLQGAPTTTFDIDIVHRRTPENVRRLVAALSRLGAVFRNDPRRIEPNESHLTGPGHALLETRFGDLDCLGAIDGDQTFETLQDRSEELQFDTTTRFRVVSLAVLIDIKRRAARPKDLAALPLLEATLEEARRLRRD
jgi:hypothetical protein